jgi:hypothetical protein
VGLRTIDPEDVWFPFYGDALVTAPGAREALTALGFAPGAADALANVPADPSTLAVYEKLLGEAARRAGMPPEATAPDPREGFFDGLVRRLHRPLSWLANRSGLDQAVISMIFADVAAYLDRADVRDRVLAAVRSCLPDAGRMVLVSHSLGTVVAMDLLASLPPGLEVETLVTAGSPLGMDAVSDSLRGRGVGRPAVATWLNAWCPADAVAIGCPLADQWGSGIVEVVTDNAKDRAHDIAEYLGNGKVAQAVGESLT